MSYMQSHTHKSSLTYFKACFLVLLLCIFCSFGAPTKAYADNDLEHTRRLGLELETNFWTLVENHNTKGLKEKVSPIFQGQNPTAFQNRDQFIASLLPSQLTSFTFSKFIATQHHNVLVISYEFFPVGTGLVNGSNISVWKKGEHHWKMISHSFFNLNQ